MKQLLFILFISFFANNLHSQTSNNVHTYQENLDKKEDFWSKLKSAFKSKKKTKNVVRTSEPVLVKSDPNRTVYKVRKEKKWKNEEDEVNAEPKKPASSADRKKTFAQRWSELVNGKDYVPQKNYGRPKKIITAKEEYAVQPVIKKDGINAAKKNQPVKSISPQVEKNEKEITPVIAANKRVVTPTKNTPVTVSKNKKPISREKTMKANLPVETKTQEKVAEAPVVIDNTIRNEIKPLSLTQSVSGTAAYFFSGVTSGKFYAVTNIASKGSVIKITNAQNGKSLLAEVMESLPPADAKRGILLKLSDNAKMPLGQKNNSFTVKVNY